MAKYRRVILGHAEGNAILTSRASCCQILSRDSVTVSVDAVVYFNVIDAEQALCSVDDFRLGRRTARRTGQPVRPLKSTTSVCALLPWDRLRSRLSTWGGSHHLIALSQSLHYASNLGIMLD